MVEEQVRILDLDLTRRLLRLTCERRVRLDGGELEGHLVLVSVDDQVLLGLEALQHGDNNMPS